jgi:hypothetical protein
LSKAKWRVINNFASTEAYGHNGPGLDIFYAIQTRCYIHLGNKTMAERSLKEVKRFNSVNVPTDSSIKHINTLELQIQKMRKHKKMKKKEVKTRAKCSSYECQNVESHPREFKTCMRCRTTKYCSRKCQKKHWKQGHKKECMSD